MKRVTRVFFSVLPFLICAGLLYAALFVKPSVTGASIKPAPIERRDKFFGIEIPAKNVLWAAGTNGKVVLSVDGGKIWVVQDTPVREHLQDIAAWDSQKAVAVGNGGVVIVTGDGGRTWREVEAPRSEVANKLMRVRTFPDGSAWAVGEMGALLQSRDGGLTWRRCHPEEDVALNDVFFIDGKTGWVVGEFGRLLHTTDGGSRWEHAPGPIGSTLTAIAFRDGRHGVAVGLEGVVIRTEDGGGHWVEAARVTREHLLDVVWHDAAGSWIAVGTKGTFLRGDASGVRWHSDRLGERDLSWHTKCVSRGNSVYMSGSNVVVLRDGKWFVFS